MGDERAGDTLSTPSRSPFSKPSSNSPLPPASTVTGEARDPADCTDACARCRDGRAAPDADGEVPELEEGVEATAPSRREALHMNTGWGAVSVADSGVPPAAAPIAIDRTRGRQRSHRRSEAVGYHDVSEAMTETSETISTSSGPSLAKARHAATSAGLS